MMTVSQARKRANFKAIEAELRYYNKLRQELRAAKDDIIESTPQQEVAAFTGPGNPVLSKVLRLSTSAAILETERRLEAIEYALAMTKRLDNCRARLVQLKYFDNKLTDIGIMEELCISYRTFHRWRRDFVTLVAERLGWEV